MSGGLHLPNGAPIDLGPAIAQQQTQQQLQQWARQMMEMYGLTPGGAVLVRTSVDTYHGTAVDLLVTASPVGFRVEGVVFHDTSVDRRRVVPWHAVAEIGAGL